MLSSIPEVGSEYQLHLERKADGKDYKTIKTELAKGIDQANNEDVKARIIKMVQSKILVSCGVLFCAYGELPRFEGKTKRIFDNRGV